MTDEMIMKAALRVTGQPPPPEPPSNDEATISVPKGWTVADLMDAEFPEPNWVVKEMIPEGLTFLTGRPKVGKSWMALQIACAVGTGGKFLGKKVQRGKVLFLAFESSARQLKERIEKQGIPRDADIRFFTNDDWPLLHKGGLQKLFVEHEREGYNLSLIDTLARGLSGLKADEHILAPYIDQMQTFASKRAVSLMCLDHNRKPGDYIRDPIDDLIGTTAKSRPLDAIWGIYKTRGKIGASLLGTGREFPDAELAIRFDGQFFCWQPADHSDRQEEILEALEALGKSQITPIANFIGLDKGNAHRLISIMVEDGLAIRTKEGGKVFYENNE
jgi:RecA-family ATPase